MGSHFSIGVIPYQLKPLTSIKLKELQVSQCV